ncbi:hydantoinase/dihydropyrimidinase family protein [Aspergillus neoniger CBS 115656]|uniref:Allantoinase n=1 Tax=Aspergillus neoniger (strain CBS 115656) TaxID=1448310 RepID=A0A318YZJ2_ASPNB|nr:allantoinase [Aspergillus neoniger CBS 115656]PYH30302.1 allantoinase [Aspergillus neoniger CBS 115656]
MLTTSFDCVVLDGIVVTAADVGRYDIGIKDGKIAILAPARSLAIARSSRVIDAEGAYVMPGGIDAHVHLAEPRGQGQTSDTFTTGSRSAIAGGTTSIIAFAPQDKSDPSLVKALETAQKKAENAAYCDYALHLMISNPNREVLDEFSILRERGVSSAKIFMTYESMQLRDGQVMDVLMQGRKDGVTVLIHAENGDMLTWMTEQLENRQLLEPKYHATSRPQILESEATSRAISLSQFIHTPILIVHVSSPLAANTIRGAQTNGWPIFAETCPQYLFLTRKDLDKLGFEGAKCICSPPPREGENDLESIWTGLQNGTFTILSSDHSPYFFDDDVSGKKIAMKDDVPLGRFRNVPNGCPGVETRLPLVWNSDRLTPQKFVEVASTNPAKMYGLYPQKGSIIPGISDADLTIWYPSALEPFPITNSALHHNVDYTPYEGHMVTQWPRYTLLRGEVIWDRDNGGIVGQKGYGKFLKRGRSAFCREQSELDFTKF